MPPLEQPKWFGFWGLTPFQPSPKILICSFAEKKSIRDIDIHD
jgi:hypothetical protein